MATAKKKYGHLTLFLTGIFILGILITTIMFFQNKINNYESNLLDYKEINISAIIVEGNTAGFNTDTDSLNFGKNSPGGTATRWFYISSEQTSNVTMVVEGTIMEFIYLDNSTFVLESNEQKKITAQLTIPLTTQPGNYTGIIKIYFWKP